VAQEKILVVDDEPGVRGALESILRDEGFEVASAESAEAALELIARRPFDAVLLDIWLPGMDGIEALLRIRERNAEIQVVMISGHGTIETAVRAAKLGAFDFVEKPLSLEKTLLVLRNALRQRRLEQRNRRLMEQLTRDTEFLGRSAGAERVRADVAAAASTDAPVLVCGERGTGRETVARRIHAEGTRSGASFVEVPCAALDGEAAGRALFGENGDGSRLRLAAGGTLFLEDADRLEPPLQRRLAAWLGSPNAGAMDLRLLASSGPNASGLVPELQGLLDVVRIRVPSLRERREDVALLAERFVSDLAREYGRPGKRLDPACLAALTAWHWPGNVRELRNLMERVLLLAPGDVVRIEDLPEEMGGARPPVEDLYGEFESLREGLRAFERFFLRRVIAEAGADLDAAARSAGIARAELERRIADLGLA
jgi:two-component system, NtrC family, nitrogen regulation response regulator NtrX